LIGNIFFAAGLGWHKMQGHDWRPRPCRQLQGTATIARGATAGLVR
jgi:hypothetical protein